MNVHGECPGYISDTAIASTMTDNGTVVYLFGGYVMVVIGINMRCKMTCIINRVDKRLNHVKNMFKLSLNSMTWTRCTGNVPCARNGHTLIAMDGDIVMFGGWDGKDWNNDFHVYHPDADIWSELMPSHSRRPCGRSHHAACAVGNTMYITGGHAGGTFGDVWSVNLATCNCTKLSDVSKNAHLSVSRSNHTAVAMPDGTLWVWGGISDDGNRLSHMECVNVSFAHVDVTKSFVELPVQPFVAGQECGFKIILRTHTNAAVRLGPDDDPFDIDVVIRDEHGNPVRVEVDSDLMDDKRRGKYHVRFYPKVVGSYSVHVSVQDEVLVSADTCALVVVDHTRGYDSPMITHPLPSSRVNATPQTPATPSSPWMSRRAPTQADNEHVISIPSPHTEARHEMLSPKLKRVSSFSRLLHAIHVTRPHKRLRSSGDNLLVWEGEVDEA